MTIDRLVKYWNRIAKKEAMEIYKDNFNKNQAEYCSNRVSQLQREYEHRKKAYDEMTKSDRDDEMFMRRWLGDLMK